MLYMVNPSRCYIWLLCFIYRSYLYLFPVNPATSLPMSNFPESQEQPNEDEPPPDDDGAAPWRFTIETFRMVPPSYKLVYKPH